MRINANWLPPGKAHILMSHRGARDYRVINMSLEEKIVNVLGASDRPMKALDIARAIPGYEKKDVNRVIYHMREVERSNPGVNPPLWRLYTGTVPIAATPLTPQARPQLQPQKQTTTTTTQAATDSHGISNSGAMGQGAGENVPISGNHHGSAASLTDAMSKISIGDGSSATWDDKLLATVEKTEDGGLKVKPIPREAIINRGMGDHIREDSAQGESLCPPVQESCSNEEIQATSSLPKINQINLSSDHETTKGLDHYEKRSENEAKRKEYSSQVFDHALQGTGKSYSEAAQSRAQGSVPQQSSSSSPTDSKTKKKPTIAANFSGVGASSSIALKQQILEILKNETKPIDSFKIAQRLGHSTRAGPMRLLQELKDEGKVSELVRDKVSHWSIRE